MLKNFLRLRIGIPFFQALSAEFYGMSIGGGKEEIPPPPKPKKLLKAEKTLKVSIDFLTRFW